MCEVSELVNANELSLVWCISVIGRMDRDMGMGMDQLGIVQNGRSVECQKDDWFEYEDDDMVCKRDKR